MISLVPKVIAYTTPLANLCGVRFYLMNMTVAALAIVANAIANPVRRK